MNATLQRAPFLLLFVYPIMRWTQSLGRPIPQRELDSVGHVWTVWSSSLGDPLRSELVAYPQGADLLPILGGWLDIFLGSSLVRLGMDAIGAFNLVLVGYLLLTGAGIALLSRALGAAPWAATIAGILAQLDPTLLWNLRGGRSEQISVGFLALALAGALSCWRREGAWRWLACGTAGAGVIYASWEYGFWLAFAMAWLAPFVLWSGRPPGALRRWLLAALTTAIIAGPFAALFLIRSSKIRVLDEGLDMLSEAPRHAVPLLGWFTDPLAVRTGTPLLLVLLALPWAARAEDRRIVVGVMLGLALTLLLALGPEPGLWTVGDLGPVSWAPYTFLQSTPILGWFHTPDRLLIGWCIAAPVAAALVLDRLSRSRLPLAARALLVVGLVAVFTWGNLDRARSLLLLQYAPWSPQSHPAIRAVGEAPVEGALLDLPPRDPGINSLLLMELQLVHERPSPYHATLPHLTTASVADLGERYGIVAWLAQAGGSAATEALPQPTVEEVKADVERLRDDGYAFVVLHPNMVPRDGRRASVQLLTKALGRPYAANRQAWMAWSLTGLEAPEIPPAPGGPPPGQWAPR